MKKSISLTAEDRRNIACIIKKDNRIEKPSPAEVLRVSFENAAAAPPDWNKIIEEYKKLPPDNTSGKEIDEIVGGNTKTFIIDNDLLAAVSESIKTQLNLLKPRFSYITRLCLYYLRLSSVSLKEESTNDTRSKYKHMSIEDFCALDTDEKLVEIYKMISKIKDNE